MKEEAFSFYTISCLLHRCHLHHNLLQLSLNLGWAAGEVVGDDGEAEEFAFGGGDVASIALHSIHGAAFYLHGHIGWQLGEHVFGGAALSNFGESLAEITIYRSASHVAQEPAHEIAG